MDLLLERHGPAARAARALTRAAGIVFAVTLPAQQAPRAAIGRALSLEDYSRIETVSSPVISPDGERVAFVRSYVIDAENRRASEIWLARTDGSAPPRRLTTPAFSATDPRWSPDGKLVAFVSRRRVAGSAEGDSAGSSIWFLRMDEPGEAFQIAGVAGPPIFSPDNKWIAFTRRAPAAKPRPPGTDLERRLAERFKGRIYDWMNARFDQRGYLPDPRDSLAAPPNELYVVPRTGGAARQLTRLGVDVQEAVWSPDSRTLALIANAHQRDEYTYERSDLWVVSLDGQIRRLTDDGYDHAAPAWSPDGRYLVFLRQQGLTSIIREKQGHGGAIDLFRMPAAGGAMENLTAAWDLIPQRPLFDSDGGRVFFTADAGGDRDLFRVTAGRVDRVTKGEGRRGSFSFASSARRMAYIASDATHPAEVVAAAIDGSGERRLSAFNDSLVADVALSAAQPITYRSKDGTKIEGWVILPRAYDSARGRYPLILAMHGGPHSAYGNDFNFQFQLWAANGYAVLYTNPRGSTGYGEKFLWATWGGGWGVRDYEDVMAGVDYALSRYPIDPKRLGVTGYSYGGFLTNWVITHTSRFAAAISGAGISNWISDYGTADIPRTKESEFLGAPWEPEAYALLWRQSPIAYAGNVTTPTLFIHGEADLRVPIEQAEQMYTALKKRKVPARMVRYTESYHGGWTPWNTTHRYWQELKWWSEWLAAKQAT